MTKECRMTKPETRPTRHSGFVILSSFVIRHSSLGRRRSSTTNNRRSTVFKSLLSLVGHRRAVTTVRRRPGVRLTLEALEGRWAPAILTVNSVADNTTKDSVLTLREAIQIVDGTLGRSLSTQEQARITGTLGTNDTIQFSLPAGP